ncbi:hypothetical protein BC940DRAFT_296783 [Gongronella butleri]|nr:hypothetical protein BC940DRAFT_296783 [Gongronella butleri]
MLFFIFFTFLGFFYSHVCHVFFSLKQKIFCHVFSTKSKVRFWPAKSLPVFFLPTHRLLDPATSQRHGNHPASIAQ